MRTLGAGAEGPSQWRGVRNVLNGSHPGCIEGRDWLPYLRDHQVGTSARACEFDGRRHGAAQAHSVRHTAGRPTRLEVTLRSPVRASQAVAAAL